MTGNSFNASFVLQIVSKDLSEPIRSHKDLNKDTVPQYHKAVKYYESLAKQLVNQGHVLDLFACALDQVCRESYPHSTFLLARGSLKNILGTWKVFSSGCQRILSLFF